MSVPLEQPPVPGPIPTGVVSRRSTEARAAATAAEARRPRPRTPLHWFGRTVLDVIRKADRDRLLGLSAETAFFSVLSLFPAMLAAAAVLGQLGTFVGEGTATRVEDAVLDFLDRLLTETAAPVVNTVQDLFESSGNALTLATALALISLSTAFSTVINTVNIAYDVPETRGWWRRRWLGLLLGTGTVITGAIAVTLLVVGPLFGRPIDYLIEIGLDDVYNTVLQWARFPVAFLLLVLWATTMYHLAPARRPRWRDGLPGALLAALLWLAASLGLNIYLEVIVTRSPIFGALGGGLILMTWFYLLCAGLLIGAELNTILQARRLHRLALKEQRTQAMLSAEAVEEPAAEPPAAVTAAPTLPVAASEASDEPPAPTPLRGWSKARRAG